MQPKPPAPTPMLSLVSQALTGASRARRDEPRPGPTPEQLERQRAARARAEADVRRRCWPKLATAILAGKPRTRSAILLGPSGCGKTSAARYLCLGRHAQWVKGDQLATCEREQRLGEGEPLVVSGASTASMLVLDDLRAGQDVSALWRILDRRYDRALPTIATTGLTRDGLREHLGAAGLRRLTEQFAGDAVLIVDCHGAAP